MEADPAVTWTAEGSCRLAGTRVSLDSIVHAYWQGRSLEAIVEDFPTLTPEQVRDALAFYLRNRAEIDTDLDSQERIWERLRAESEARNGPLLDRLRAARAAADAP